jgi:hypothetical protein
MTVSRKPAFYLAALSVILTASISISAQSGRGSMSGYVASRVGNAGIPNAKIELEPIETISRHPEARSTVTNKDGLYEILQITMGEYNLIISAEGYERYKTRVFVMSDSHINWGTVLRKKKNEKSGSADLNQRYRTLRRTS